MADRITIARPYAKAAFRAARSGTDNGSLTQWSQALTAAAATVGDERVAPLLDSPRTTPEELGRLVIGIADTQDGPGENAGVANFINTLATNRRLGYLPEIAALFDQLKDDAEGTVDVTVTSAAALDDSEQQRLSQALERRFGKRVRVHTAVDSGLIGGAVIRAGDLVIDGSFKSRLERLAYELTA